jgi:Xaa-Pro aminopeptidase
MAIDKDRIRRLKKALRDAKLDAMVLRLPENIVMSFGVWPLNGLSHALFTAVDGPVALIAPSCEEQAMGDCWADDVRIFIWPRLGMDDPQQFLQTNLRELAEKHGLKKAAIGYEGSFETVAPAHNPGEVFTPCEASIASLKAILPNARWRDCTDLLHAQRAIKTPAEINKLKLAHKVAGYGIGAFHDAVQPGKTEADLAGEVYHTALARGVKAPGAAFVNIFPQISTGPNTVRAWWPIVKTGRRKIKAGEIAVLELAVCVNGFWADVTRVQVAGKASEVQKRAFKTVKAAQAAAIACIKPGVKAETPDLIARQVLIDGGFEKEVVHLTGHGLGFRYHEPTPFLIEGNNEVLKKGHVFSVEPGLYSPEWGGIRLEDNVAVTADGTENLTRAPKRL